MADRPRKELNLFDSTCLIVGIIIGAGVYQAAPDIAKGALTWYGVFAIWAIGGLLSLFGALGYAELATAYPREGGDYVYLSRAYGRWAGFLFGWVQLVIVRPGDIAAMAFAFATYARAIHDPLAASGSRWTLPLYAAAATAALTAVNIIGVRQGKWTQNILTTVKAAGLLAIVAIALLAPRNAPSAAPVDSFPTSVALILVLFAFGGWNEMAYVAAEVKNPKRNIVRALVLGTVAVTVLYLLVNGAFLYTLGYAGTANSKAVASDAIAAVFPKIGARLIAALICISALGAINGLVFTGARISYAVGADYRQFRILGKWHPRTQTPVFALLLQGLIAVGLILLLGTFLDTIVYTAAAVYTFYLATNLAVIVLRFKEPQVERPYRVTGYPFTTIIFCAACAFFIYSGLNYAYAVIPKGLLVSSCSFLVGIIVYLTVARKNGRDAEGE